MSPRGDQAGAVICTPLVTERRDALATSTTRTVRVTAEVRVRLGIADHGDRAPVGRPPEAIDRPWAVSELARLSAITRGHEQVRVPAVEVPDAVALVGQRPHGPGDGRPAALLLTFGRTRIVHDRVRIAHDASSKRKGGPVRDQQAVSTPSAKLVSWMASPPCAGATKT
jgi:hypothetical protein